mmetsp:Transcript_37990/g.112491  ORF Transcript_37990/g.112491 Transcript_37990/m.112491 type:complete len:204 (-) Transcript_37990:128-739(-)
MRKLRRGRWRRGRARLRRGAAQQGALVASQPVPAGQPAGSHSAPLGHWVVHAALARPDARRPPRPNGHTSSEPRPRVPCQRGAAGSLRAALCVRRLSVQFCGARVRGLQGLRVAPRHRGAFVAAGGSQRHREQRVLEPRQSLCHGVCKRRPHSQAVGGKGGCCWAVKGPTPRQFRCDGVCKRRPHRQAVGAVAGNRGRLVTYD